MICDGELSYLSEDFPHKDHNYGQLVFRIQPITSPLSLCFLGILYQVRYMQLHGLLLIDKCPLHFDSLDKTLFKFTNHGTF